MSLLLAACFTVEFRECVRGGSAEPPECVWADEPRAAAPERRVLSGLWGPQTSAQSSAAAGEMSADGPCTAEPPPHQVHFNPRWNTTSEEPKYHPFYCWIFLAQIYIYIFKPCATCGLESEMVIWTFVIMGEKHSVKFLLAYWKLSTIRLTLYSFLFFQTEDFQGRNSWGQERHRRVGGCMGQEVDGYAQRHTACLFSEWRSCKWSYGILSFIASQCILFRRNINNRLVSIG